MWLGSIWLPLDTLHAIERTTDEETCGVIVGRRLSRNRIVVRNIISMPNRHPDPVNHFRITKNDVLTCTPDYGPIMGSAHTHGPGQESGPSPHDLQSLVGRQLGIVWAVESSIVTLYVRGNIIKTIDWRTKT